MRGKILLLFTFAALLLLAAYLLFFQSKKETLRPIFTADSTAVARIELREGDQSLTLERQNTLWLITRPTRWNAEESRMQRFLREVVFERYATTPIAEGAAALRAYGLDSPGVLKIRVYGAKGKLLREAWFANPGNPFDYFRYPGQNKVFQIRQKVAGIYNPGFESWRSPHVLKIYSEQMLTIKVRHATNSYLLTRKGSLWHYKDSGEDFDIPAGNETMGKLLNILTQLGSYAQITSEEVPPPDSLPACTVTIALTDGQTRQIDFFPYGQNYLLRVDTHPGLYFVTLFDTVFRFTRHASLFRARVGYPPQ